MGGATGSSLRDQLHNVWKQTGIKPKELEDLLTVPTNYMECWGWFLSLNESRSSNGYGLNPIAYSDISAYFDLHNISPEIWEVDLLKRLDREVMSIYSEKARQDAKKK